MGTRAKYWVIAEALEEQMLGMGPNSLLPAEQQLARRFQVSRVTVRRALSCLEQKGLLSRERGRGTIVNPPKITRHLLPLTTIEQDLHDQGLKLETRVAQWQPATTPPDPIRPRLRLAPHETVACLSLIRAVDDRIFCLDQHYIPSALSAQFNPQLVATSPVLHLLEKLAGLKIVLDTWETEITPVTYEVASLLGIVPGVLVLVNTSTRYFQNGQPAEAGVMSYRIDRVKFESAATCRL